MLKRLIQGLLLGLLAVHINAFALGLGKIQLDSALNQPLSAEIELLSASPEDADSVDVSLASYETFSKVGIDRPSILALLRFNVVAKGDGYAIKIDSHDPIREPFLDFILEVTWSSGRVLREYTLLLDPPELKKAQPAQIQAPISQPVTKATKPQQQATKPTRSIPSVPAQKKVSKRPTLKGEITSTDKGGISYGPVRNGETLWGIAKEMRSGSSVSTQQMLMALLEENPDAFIAGDINRLKRGSILRLNKPEMLAAIGGQERVAAQREQSVAMRKSAEMDEQMIATDSAESKRPSLKLVTPDTKSASEKMGANVAEGGDNSALRQELMLALEISEAQRRENDALKERMGDLQKQLDSLKRLITLKDGDLAQMQQQLGQADEPVPMAATEPVLSEPVVQPTEEPVVEVVEPSALVMPDLSTQETIAEALVQDAPTLEAAPQEAPVAKVMPEAKPQPATPRVVPAPVVTKPVAEPDFIDAVLSDPMFMATGGGALILILLLALLVIKRRGNRFHESILSGDASSMGATATGGPDTSFLSDLAISGLAGGGMESDDSEVDPITEADVYMAYGRFQQAESLLKDALDSTPDRVELKNKLLEVCHMSKDKAQFDAIIAESSEQLQEDEAAWKKILIMGHELSPENPLFAEAPEVEEEEDEFDLSAAEGDDSAFDDVLDIGIDLDELSAEMESSGEDELDIDLGLDFSDLDNDVFSTSIDESSEEEAETASIDDTAEDEKPAPEETFDLGEFDIEDEAPEDDGTIDFNIDDLDLDSLQIGDSSKSSVVEPKTADVDTEEAEDLDLSLDDDVSTETDDLSAELDDALASMEDDLHDIGDLSDLSEGDSEADDSDEDDGDFDLGDLDDLDFDFDSMESDTTEKSDAEEENAPPESELDAESSSSEDSASDETPSLELDDMGDFDLILIQ